MVHIPAIVLTQGNHHDIERTGHGCIMNVIAYLQGEAPTDRPQGVDEAFRTLAIYCNDHLDFGPRQELLMPLVSRLMNTRTQSWHELANRLQRLMKLERQVCGREFPLSDFLEHMGPNLPERIACVVEQIISAADRRGMWGRESELCHAIVRALDDMLPDSDLNPKQRQDIEDLGAVAAKVKVVHRTWEVAPMPGFVPWQGMPWQGMPWQGMPWHTVQFEPIVADKVRELTCGMIGAFA